jgi:Fe-S-cluster containining protein
MESERTRFPSCRQSVNNANDREIFQSFQGNEFQFDCHKDIACFTACCAGLKLILTPYDILRIKHRLNLSSWDFLERYTETVFESPSQFPRVQLKMAEDEKASCPFVTGTGCTIYEDRPGACRIYPLGRAALKVDREKGAREKFFMVHEAHCLGFQEPKRWTIEEWMAKEGVDEYNAMNDQWLEIITSQKSLGPNEDARKKIQMFFMASYNLDKFREFIFNSRFFARFEVAPDLREEMALDDTALMKFGFQWLKFSLFGENSISVRPRPLQS